MKKADNPCCRLLPVDEDIRTTTRYLFYDLSNYTPKACLDKKSSDFVREYITTHTLGDHLLFVNGSHAIAYPEEEEVIAAIKSLGDPGPLKHVLVAILDRTPYPHIRNAAREKLGDPDIEPAPEVTETLLAAKEKLVSGVLGEVARRSNSPFPVERSFYMSLLGEGDAKGHTEQIFRDVFDGKEGSFERFMRFMATVSPDDILVLRNHCNSIAGKPPGWGRKYPPEDAILRSLDRVSKHGVHIVKEELEQIAISSPFRDVRIKAGRLLPAE